MTTKTLGTLPLEFLLSEANGERSRAEGILQAGENLAAGAVLGQLTANSKYVQYDETAADGSENVAAILCVATDATAADVSVALIVRDAEVITADLAWGAGTDPGEQATAIAAMAANLNIIAR